MVTVSSADMVEAYSTFRKEFKLAYNKNTRTLFKEFIGLSSEYIKSFSPSLDAYELDELPAQRIKYLTGPHAETMIKAMRARNGL